MEARVKLMIFLSLLLGAPLPSNKPQDQFLEAQHRNVVNQNVLILQSSQITKRGVLTQKKRKHLPDSHPYVTRGGNVGNVHFYMC